MPVREPEKLFMAMSKKWIEKDFYLHEEVFSDLNASPFTIKEAAEYLETAEITIRRYVKNGSLKARKLWQKPRFRYR